MKIWLLVLLSFSPFTRADGDEVISSIVGTLTDTSVTSREVKISHLVELAFKRQGFDQLELKSPKFSGVISETLLEWMLYLEFQAMKAEDVSAADRQKLEQDFNGLIRSSEAASNYWKKLEVTTDEKRQFLDRKLKAKKILQFRTQSSVVSVTDRDALNYYQQNKTKFGSSPFEKLKENIKSFLEQQNAETRLKDWLTILQKKYNVKHLGAKSS